MATEIALTGGQSVTVDDNVAKWIGGYNWYCSMQRYAVRALNGGRQKIWLHRLIAGYPFYYKVEHRNGNTFDCRTGNLRVIGPDRRECDWRGKLDGTSQFTGVTWDPRGLWRAEIAGMSAGLWDNEMDAARAYNSKVVQIHGPGAVINHIQHLPESEQSAWPFNRKDFRQSGYAGAYLTAHGKYRARTMINGHRIDLGQHENAEDAKAAIDKARSDNGLQ
jgi:hypothetical protein